MEKASTEVMSIWRRNNVKKSTWRTHRYFVDFESRIHVEISMSNRRHNFHVDSSFKIYVISTNFPRGISTSNRWQIDEDVSIGTIFTALKQLIESRSKIYYINFHWNTKTVLFVSDYSVKSFIWISHREVFYKNESCVLKSKSLNNTCNGVYF